ncbi:universal stress protein [Saccharopolyspora rhizosphaerae]|uniref:Universal stress protein n=1 Tax=Saccharopolyspora rhizosphaerae TaxID=2492662 RepID=A0A426JKH8_9PSEU|nr:universal stress protein [Saccharopolyspora rhizosphaerae]RRO13671.1 universal stress protein [Saccharopolyspora rhizosphaerae]
MNIDGGVVVGVDTSAASLRALKAAAEEAECRGAPLHVVRAWSIRTAPRPADCPPNAVPSIDAFQQEVERETAKLVAAKLGENPKVKIEIHAVHSPSPQALLAASRGADLLVVGHRGRGGFAGLMLGSVAEQCVRHASCPVLVVRPSL